jgi:hypothetical protein
MSATTVTILATNPNVDINVVREFDRLQQATNSAKPIRSGADYRLSHPLATTIAFSRTQLARKTRG